MPFLPQHPAQPTGPRQRGGTRVQFSEITPAVIRLANGGRVPGKLKLVSITGGLLSLSRPLQTDSVVKVMFLAPTGSVLGKAKMLSPLAWGVQPFQFLSLLDDDESRLKAAIQRSVERSERENKQHHIHHQQIEKNRPW